MLEFKNFTDITKDSLELRREVFIEEQNVPIELELEANENQYIHCCLYLDNALIAYARLFLGNPILIGRVCVKQGYRHLGYGTKIMEYAEQQIPISKTKILIHAQLSAQSFYEKLGYIPFGQSFSEANIDHIMMEKNKV